MTDGLGREGEELGKRGWTYFRLGGGGAGRGNGLTKESQMEREEGKRASQKMLSHNDRMQPTFTHVKWEPKQHSTNV